MIGIMNSSRLTVYPYGVASAGGVCVGAGIRTVCRAIPAGTATIASMATTSNALFCGSEELREEGLDIRGTSRNFQPFRSEEHTSELQSRFDLVCRLLLEKKKIYLIISHR